MVAPGMDAIGMDALLVVKEHLADGMISPADLGFLETNAVADIAGEEPYVKYVYGDYELEGISTGAGWANPVWVLPTKEALERLAAHFKGDL